MMITLRGAVMAWSVSGWRRSVVRAARSGTLRPIGFARRFLPAPRRRPQARPVRRSSRPDAEPAHARAVFLHRGRRPPCLAAGALGDGVFDPARVEASFDG